MNRKKWIVISAILLIVILAGIGIFVVVSKNNESSNKNEDDEIVYYLDRYSDTYASFKVKVKENEDTYTVTLMAGDEVIFTEDVIYDAEKNQIIAENDIIFNRIEVVEDSEVVYFGEATGDTKFVDSDEYEAGDVNYGKVISFEKTENEDEYKIFYGSSENGVEEGGTEEETSEEVTEDTSSTDVSTEKMTTEKETAEEDTTTEAVNNNGSSGNSGNNSSTGNGGNNNSQQSGNSGGNSSSSTGNGGSGSSGTGNSGSSGNSNSGSSSTGNGSSSNTATPPVTTETPTTETPSTEAPETPTTEEVHQHDWEEVWGEKTMQTGSIGECVYCKYQSNDDIADHCTLCGGIWTHEELKDKDPYAYNLLIGRPKGSNWRYIPVYETVKTILYYKCECGAVKYSE